LREIRHNVGQGTARNYTSIDGNPFTPAIQVRELQYLVGQFLNGVTAHFRLNTGMSAMAAGAKCVIGEALARTYNIAVCARCLQNQRSLDVLAGCLYTIKPITFFAFFIVST